jgi:acyl carrier protein
MYHTGDIGAWTSKGEIQFLGRNDNQVKIRGFRVELGEIEAALQTHPSVRECVAILQKQLIAYLVLQKGWELQYDELRTALKEILPDYMIPTFFIELKQIPLNFNGKVDRQALLQAFDETDYVREQAYIPPRTEQERALADIWMELLLVKRVSIDDNFFELGGHSLSVVQLIFRIREKFGVDISLRTLFERATIEEIVKLIDGQSGTN